MKVKATVRELIKLNLRNLFPYKSNKEIKEMIEARCKETITEPEALEIIKYMYEKKDFENLNEKMESLFYRIPLKLPEYNQIFNRILNNGD